MRWPEFCFKNSSYFRPLVCAFVIEMCLVCFINAEESRAKTKDVYCLPAGGTTTSSVSDDGVESSDDGNSTDTGLDSVSKQHAIHYFAIGSMTNMTALALRELTPISSQPAMLKGYRMVFRGSGGMATAEEDGDYEPIPLDSPEYPFSCIHGVLHLLSAPHMKILDDFEGGYHRKDCKVVLYDECATEVNACVYQMDRAKWSPPSLSSLDANKAPEVKPAIKHELPTERYLDIIAQGCAAHGVSPKWVEFVRKHACIPRKSASEFSSFSSSMTSAKVPIIPWDQVRAHNGLNGMPMWIVINNKVLEFKGDVTSFFPFGYFVKHKIGGTDFTVKFAKGFFEPMYIHGPAANPHSAGGGGYGNTSFSHVTSSSQLGNEHRAWVEDQFANPPPVLASSKWALVGVVDVTQQLTDPVTLTRNSTFGMRRSKLIHCKSTCNSPKRPKYGIAESYTSDSESLDTSAHSTATNATSSSLKFPTLPTIVGGASSVVDSTVVAQSTPTNAAYNTIASEVLDLTEDILSGYNHFFISGTTSGTWIVPDGVHPGQTLYVRKTATEDFDAPVTIRIRNHSLHSPNKRGETYNMPVDVYYLSWCWDGTYWYLEQVGRAER